MARKKKDYTASDIEVLEPLEGVRARPGMYIGSTDEFGVLQIVKEIIDNGIDEALGGHCDHIMVDISEKNHILVWDNGRGIPVEKHPKHPKKSTLEIIFTHLHAGGKLGKDGAYEGGSIGTHGVGAAVTNALSSKFSVYTRRKRTWYQQTYEKGKPTIKVTKLKGDVFAGIPKAKGTLVTFTPDKKIFGKAKLPEADLKNMLELAAYLHPKVTFDFILKRTAKGKPSKSKSFHQPKGVTALLKKMIKRTKSEAFGKPIIIQQPGLDVVLQWTDHVAENLNSYVCGSPTPLGGTHMQGFAKALNEAVKPYKPKRGTFKPEDLRVGLQGVVNLTIAAPEFSGQTKGKLATKEANEVVYNAVLPELKKFFAKNKKMVRDLIKRAIELAEGRQKFVADRKLTLALKTKKKGTHLLPPKLTQATTKKAEDREVYFVEGDSAAGTGKVARDPKTQEILALRGKIINVYKDRKQKAFANQEIIDILKSIGFDPTKTEPVLSLRVGKIILLSDPDVDGKHINVLLLSLLWRVLPELFERGLVYVADAPLYNTYFRGKRYFAGSRAELIKKAPKGLKADHIQRIKGWGEVNADTLKSVAFNPKTRVITRVTPLSARRLPKFEALVGEGTQFRKELLGLS